MRDLQLYRVEVEYETAGTEACHHYRVYDYRSRMTPDGVLRVVKYHHPEAKSWSVELKG